MTDPMASRPRRPPPVALAAVILVLLALLQVPVAALFVAFQAELAASITAASPGMAPEVLDNRIAAATAEGIVVHAMLFVVYLAAAWTTRTPGAGIRIFLTALAGVATFTDSLILGQLPAVFPNERALILGTLALASGLRLGLALLLWMPASARAWYARRATV